VTGRGRLLVVGTPIGNLGDLSPRAAEALRAADLVVAEDTRVTGRLLAHLGARVPSVSFNEHNAARRLPQLLARLAEGRTLALTSDAGMPGVSDPGAALVRAARAAGARVGVVPGPSAVAAAMAVSGVEAVGFVFGGFLPSRPAGERRRALERLLEAAGATGMPLLVYESPHRIRRLLGLLGELVPESEVAVCRELTKLHEQVLVGRPADVADQLREERGEIAVVVSGLAEQAPQVFGVDPGAMVVAGRRAGIANRTLVELLRAGGIGRREAYRLVESTGGER
jgi:16S rRNA (cytidine1402-2'-O)-methyltransferase